MFRMLWSRRMYKNINPFYNFSSSVGMHRHLETTQAGIRKYHYHQRQFFVGCQSYKRTYVCCSPLWTLSAVTFTNQQISNMRTDVPLSINNWSIIDHKKGPPLSSSSATISSQQRRHDPYHLPKKDGFPGAFRLRVYGRRGVQRLTQMNWRVPTHATVASGTSGARNIDWWLQVIAHAVYVIIYY